SLVSIAAIPDQQAAEGDNFSFQVTASDQNNHPLTYSADVLPAGLTLDSQTGVIAGIIAAGAADGPYQTTVSVSDGISSASQTFAWDIASLVSVTPIIDQSNNEGDTVSLQVLAVDQNNLALLYSADVLPPGLSINSLTGLISGTIAAGDALDGPYQTIVT